MDIRQGRTMVCFVQDSTTGRSPLGQNTASGLETPVPQPGAGRTGCCPTDQAGVQPLHYMI